MFEPVAGCEGALRLVPTVYPDERGTFHEWFKASEFEQATGYPLDVQQANMSTSKAGVLRGLHYAEVPPGQGKLVMCPAGAIFDVLLDVRVGSESFGRWAGFELNEENRQGLYIPAGFAHGFLALRDSTVAYLTTSEYQPEVEHGIDPYDSQVGIAWPEVSASVLLSAKDRQAPGLAEAREQGILPSAEECRAYHTELRNAWAVANEEAGL
ncbi:MULTISPECIES: dTDP-4-dehydrorhamnose 3,5-epimerase [unclassified Corynebacterium]|uniref:dTDP-4-dehydrorhamnose 3,5-epimerase n=1 Tax=unclassified Corynebacterium TaxID=2624378 RepID=UPI0029CAA8D0|nr:MULTISPECIES: dTDP-4-dehydrorhamnose 3,5-epimerase [unclassified Corynebacterium]WPF66423.1 dTDP-4-dehydrorhamnose 3,5-epimerase [Corynebacterium sp. 22KM0430]WPF68913.1 dTDP-4-dehydrorhamnose 3,5-epimerase [Corynebacterium sp. 21KM1197]